jgi:hypothetical protein
MVPGEFAVHYSSLRAVGDTSYCMVFANLEEANVHATHMVAEQPQLRCAIYDHHGFVGAPIREVSGSAYKGDAGLSPRFRRWVGSVLLLGGAILFLVDWSQDFRLSWPGMVGSRMLIPGLILLVMEAMIVLHAKYQHRHTSSEPTR